MPRTTSTPDQRDKAKRYMINYPRSNFPSDQTIGNKFGVSTDTIYHMRHELIKNGDLLFVQGHFVPKDLSYLDLTLEK